MPIEVEPTRGGRLLRGIEVTGGERRQSQPGIAEPRIEPTERRRRLHRRLGQLHGRHRIPLPRLHDRLHEQRRGAPQRVARGLGLRCHALQLRDGSRDVVDQALSGAERPPAGARVEAVADGVGEVASLLRDGLRPDCVADDDGPEGPQPEDLAQSPGIADRAGKVHSLVQVGRGDLGVVHRDAAACGQCPKQERGVVDPACDDQGFACLVHAIGCARVHLEEGVLGDRPRPHGCRDIAAVVAVREHRVEPGHALLNSPTGQPDRLQRRRQPRRQLDLRVLATPGESGPQVVQFGFDPFDALLVVVAGGRVESRGERRVVIAVPAAHRIALTRLTEPLLRVLPDRLQHSVTRSATDVLGEHQRLVDQQGEEVENLMTFDVATGCRRRGIEIESGHEHREPREQHAFRLGQQRMRPVHRRAQRLLSPHRRACPARQQPEAIVQPVPDLGQGEHPHTRGSQFDCQRDAVEPPTDVDHDGAILLGEMEIGPDPTGALGEQFHRLVAERQRRYPPDHLARNADRFPTGRQQRRRRAARLHRDHQFRARVEQMLAVVQHQQHATAADELQQRGHRGPAWMVRQAQRADHRDGHQRGVGERRQVDEPRTVVEVLGELRRQLDGKPRLANPARARQRHQAVLGQQTGHIGPVGVAAHETGELHGKMLCSNHFPSTQGWEIGADVGVAQLHHSLPTWQVAQLVAAEVRQPGVGGQPVQHHVLRGSRQHGLPAMRQVAQARGPVDRGADVVPVVAQLHLPGVYADAQPDRGQR